MTRPPRRRGRPFPQSGRCVIGLSVLIHTLGRSGCSASGIEPPHTARQGVPRFRILGSRYPQLWKGLWISQEAAGQGLPESRLRVSARAMATVANRGLAAVFRGRGVDKSVEHVDFEGGVGEVVLQRGTFRAVRGGDRRVPGQRSCRVLPSSRAPRPYRGLRLARRGTSRRGRGRR